MSIQGKPTPSVIPLHILFHQNGMGTTLLNSRPPYSPIFPTANIMASEICQPDQTFITIKIICPMHETAQREALICKASPSTSQWMKLGIDILREVAKARRTSQLRHFTSKPTGHAPHPCLPNAAPYASHCQRRLLGSKVHFSLIIFQLSHPLLRSLLDETTSTSSGLPATATSFWGMKLELCTPGHCPPMAKSDILPHARTPTASKHVRCPCISQY